jgi:hypothetical protein
MDDSPLSPLSPAGPDSGPGEDTVFAREALAVARGIGRLFARNGIWCLPEMPLRNGRRADLMGVDAKGRVVIVEIKVSRADLLGDAKWTDYLDHCDRFYWGWRPISTARCSKTPPSGPRPAGSSWPMAMTRKSCGLRPACRSRRRGARSRWNALPVPRCAVLS